MDIMAFFQTMTNVASHLKHENLETLKLKQVAENDFYLALAALDEALKQAKKSGLTQQMAEADANRDSMVVGLTTHIAALLPHPTKAVAEAAKRLQAIVEKYGKAIYRMPDAKETATVTNMVQDLEQEEAAKDLSTTHTAEWVAEMKKANTEFQELDAKRTGEYSQYEVGKAKAARAVLQDAFSLLGRHINAQALLTGEAPYATLASRINTEVDAALQLVKQRATLAKNAKAKTENPPIH